MRYLGLNELQFALHLDAYTMMNPQWFTGRFQVRKGSTCMLGTPSPCLRISVPGLIMYISYNLINPFFVEIRRLYMSIETKRE